LEASGLEAFTLGLLSAGDMGDAGDAVTNVTINVSEMARHRTWASM